MFIRIFRHRYYRQCMYTPLFPRPTRRRPEPPASGSRVLIILQSVCVSRAEKHSSAARLSSSRSINIESGFEMNANTTRALVFYRSSPIAGNFRGLISADDGYTSCTAEPFRVNRVKIRSSSPGLFISRVRQTTKRLCRHTRTPPPPMYTRLHFPFDTCVIDP